MIRIFSKRHEAAIFEKKLKLSLTRRMRRRIWYFLKKYNYEFYYQPDPFNNWNERTDALTEIEQELKERYGLKVLMAFTIGDKREEVNLEGFIIGAYPTQVFDVIELLYDRQDENNKLAFQSEINLILDEEGSEWRITDGQFFKIDSEFLSYHVIAKSYQLMKAEGFNGALDEFTEARNDLTSCDYKGAIHNACKSFESVLKTISGREDGNASTIIRQIVKSEFCEDLPEKFRTSFGEQILCSLPYLRNRLAGHGQGADVMDVPRLYAELSVNLAAVLNLFAIQRALELKPKHGNDNKSEDPSIPETYDDIPF